MPNQKGIRKNISMEKIVNSNHLQAAFSKRRKGLFKKASELGILCGVEVAVVVSSPGGKVYSFGNPNVNFVVERFLKINAPIEDGPSMPSDAYLSSLSELNKENTKYRNQLEQAEKRGKELKGKVKSIEDSEFQILYDTPVQNLTIQELEKLLFYMREFERKVSEKTGGPNESASQIFTLDLNELPGPSTTNDDN